MDSAVLTLRPVRITSVAQVAPPTRLSSASSSTPILGASTGDGSAAGRAISPTGPLPTTKTSAATAVRRVETRRPLHIPVIVGVSAGLYAASLVACNTLQFATDRALIADRQPVAEAIDALRSHHARMTETLAAATERYSEAVGGYEGLTSDTEALRGRLAALAQEIAAIEAIGFDTSALGGSGGPIRTVSGAGSSSRSSGSGGSTKSSGGGATTSSGGASVSLPKVAPAPAPQPAAPPATTATTGASGAP
jgi:hypothetical protein